MKWVMRLAGRVRGDGKREVAVDVGEGLEITFGMAARRTHVRLCYRAQVALIDSFA